MSPDGLTGKRAAAQYLQLPPMVVGERQNNRKDRNKGIDGQEAEKKKLRIEKERERCRADGFGHF